jgi:3-hydroxyacyl-CoA dehydrogenase
MNELVTLERRGEIAVVTWGRPPANTLPQAMRRALYDVLDALGQDASVMAVVIRGRGGHFGFGADIAEFDLPDRVFLASPDPVELTALIERMRKPVVAAMRGQALGAALELALGCHYRVAARDARFGLPEIELGLIPGAGGTQRLPRLVGFEAAAQMIFSGESVDAPRAFEIGLIDRLADTDPVDAAIDFIRSANGTGHPLRRVRDTAFDGESPDDLAAAQAAIRTCFDAARSRGRSLPACDAIRDSLLAALRLPFDEGLALERGLFLQCHASPEAAALRYGFLAKRSARKLVDVPAGTAPREITHVGVVGGGTMGRGIATAVAGSGLRVTLVESDASRAALAHDAIEAGLRRMHETGRLSESGLGQSLQGLSTTEAFAALAECDLVIEAVYEDFAVKQAVCARMGEVCRAGAMLASNTSTLDIDRLADASGRPRDFIGLHFFSPANVMKLLEVVRGANTAPEVLASAMTFARQLGKQPVVSRVCYGFIGNRMLEPYLRETEALLLEGATPRQIDRALEEFGMAMGPCRMMDLAGVDVVAKVIIEREREGGLPDDPHYRTVSRELHRLGRFGQKSSAGFYRYDGRRLLDDVDAEALIRDFAKRSGVAARDQITDTEIVERCLFPMINEGWRLLDERIAERESDVDVVWLTGYGFPAYRGGPLYHAREIGLAHVRDVLEQYGQRFGNPHDYWTPADRLRAGTSSSSHNSIQEQTK